MMPFSTESCAAANPRITARIGPTHGVDPTAKATPSMKPTEFSMTLRSSCASCDLSSSTPAPEISDTYPGTSGSTQGERNDTNPATKAAIGSGSVDIQKYCTCLLQCSRTSPGQKV